MRGEATTATKVAKTAILLGSTHQSGSTYVSRAKLRP